MTTKQKNERSITEKVRDLVLLSLPLTLGFFNWSISAHRAGAVSIEVEKEVLTARGPVDIDVHAEASVKGERALDKVLSSTEA